MTDAEALKTPDGMSTDRLERLCDQVMRDLSNGSLTADQQREFAYPVLVEQLYRLRNMAAAARASLEAALKRG